MIKEKTKKRLENLEKYGSKTFNNFNLDKAINQLIDYYKYSDV